MIFELLMVAWAISAVFMYRDAGCGSWSFSHEYEEEKTGEASHKSPVFDEETGEAYAQRFEVYHKVCQCCGEHRSLSRRLEPIDERRWESDTFEVFD